MSATPTVSPEIRNFEGAHGYAQRQPQKTAAWQTVQLHWLEYEAQVEQAHDGHGVAAFVSAAMSKFLGCGMHTSGFARVRCKSCGDDLLLPFSCKQRGICSSCDGRRMVELSAHLVDDVVPDVATRQWVLTFPHWLRFRLAFDAKLLTGALGVWIKTVTSWYRKQARQRWKIADGQCASFSVVQRFGDALVLNPHIHSVFCDGVWFAGDGGDIEPEFLELDGPTDGEMLEICVDARRRILRWLVRKGVVQPGEQWDEGQELLAEIDPVRAWSTKAALLDRVSIGKRAGQLVARLREGPVQAKKMGRRCAMADGFNIHANVRIGPMGRDALERLCRYVLRPALCSGRLELLDDGRILARLKRRWSDGTWAKVFEPLDFLSKVTALIPLPRSNLLRYHGQFAPQGRWRAAIVRTTRKRSTGCNQVPLDEATKHRRRSWAELLRRAFSIEILACLKCGGRRELIALINPGKAAARILEHVGIPSVPPQLRAARGPPDLWWD